MPTLKLTPEQDALELSLSGLDGPDFQKGLTLAKSLPGRRFNGEKKVWEVPADPEVAEKIMLALRPNAGADVLSWIRSSREERQSQLVTPLGDDADVFVPWRNKLYDFQRAFVAFAAKHPRLILADDMGLGKTFQAISALAEHQLFLLHGNDEQGLPAGVPGEAPGADQGEQPQEPSEAEGSLDADHRGGEGQALRGLRNQATEGMHGLGSRARGQTVHAGQVSAGEAAAGNDQGSGDQGRDRQVRRAMPELSQDEALRALAVGPKLIVCPNSVKGVWARELRKWLGPDTPLAVVDAASPAKRREQMQEAIKANGWVIVNWEQIRVKQEEYTKTTRNLLPNGEVRMTERKATRDVLREPLFGSTPWVSVFADEAHRAKSRKSLQTRGLWSIDAPFKLALSGTPLMNSPDELWPILKWLYPNEYTSYWRFFDTYVDYYEGYYNNKVITGVKNPDALRFELSKRLVRRTKGDKLDLPPKVREHVPVKMGSKQAKLYKDAEREMWLSIEQAIKSGDRSAENFAAQAASGTALINIPNGAVRTSRLRQVLSTPACLGGEDDSAKLDACVEIIVDAQPRQFVVFSEFVETCECLVRRLTAKGLTAKSFTGTTSSALRTKLEDAFQRGEIDVLVGTIPAMGEGVTLTAADTAIFIERHWTPAKNEQAEDRLWRNGQDNAVTILILEVPDTVDTNKVTPTNNVKKMIVSAVIQQDAVEVRTKGDSNE